MVPKLIFYRISIFFARSIRSLFGFLMIIQQLPFLFLLVFVISFGWLFYRLFGVHRIFIRSLKFLLRLSFFFRGIHLGFKLPNNNELNTLNGVNICNYGSVVYWILFAALPYDHLIVSVDQFFSNKSFRSLLFLAGFVPQEYGMKPENIASFKSRLQHYIEQDFSFWQPFSFEFRDTEPLPYLFFLGIKYNQPINIWSIKGLEYVERVSWLNRVKVTIELVQQIPIARRIPVTIAAYEQCLVQNFGLPEADKFSEQHRSSWDPQSSIQIAKEKIAQAKKQQAESEKIDPSR